MSEMHNENENIHNENQGIQEEIIKNEEIVEVENKNKIESEDGTINKVSFQDSFMSAIIDGVITGVISVAGLYIFDIILRATAGYYVKEKMSVFAIIYIIVGIFYTAIMESSKTGNTIGKRASNLKVIKIR